MTHQVRMRCCCVAEGLGRLHCNCCTCTRRAVWLLPDHLWQVPWVSFYTTGAHTCCHITRTAVTGNRHQSNTCGKCQSHLTCSKGNSSSLRWKSKASLTWGCNTSPLLAWHHPWLSTGLHANWHTNRACRAQPIKTPYTLCSQPNKPCRTYRAQPRNHSSIAKSRQWPTRIHSANRLTCIPLYINRHKRIPSSHVISINRFWGNSSCHTIPTNRD